MRRRDTDQASATSGLATKGQGRVRSLLPAAWVMGLLSVLSFNFLSAGNEVFVANRLQRIDSIVLLLFTFSLCTVLFTATQLPRLPALVTLAWLRLRDVLLINVVTMITWLAFFLGLTFLEPAVVAAVTVAIGPIATVWLRRISGPNAPLRTPELLVSIGVVLTMGLLAWETIAGQSAVGVIRPLAYLIGLPAAFVAAVGVVLTNVVSKRMHTRGWSAARLMAVRFWLLDAVALGAVVVTHRHVVLSLPDVGAVLLIVFLGTIAPLYLLQLGIERLEPLLVSFVISTTPVFTLVLQMLDARLQRSLTSAVAILIATILIVWSVIDSRPRSAEH